MTHGTPEATGLGSLTAAARPPGVELGGERQFELRYYAELLWRHRVLLGSAALAALVLGLLAGELQAPRFQARALLQVMPPNPTSLTVTDALVQTGNPMRDRQFFNTQLNVLRSRAVATRVVEKLKLGEPSASRGGGDAAGLLLRALTVEPVPETYVVELRITHGDPAAAALWANTVADVYMDYSIEGQVEAARRAYAWVNERLQETQLGMQQAQDRLLRSYQGQDLFVPDGNASAIATSIAKLNEDHVQAQARRIELEAQLGEFAERRRRGERADAIPQVGGDAAIAEIKGRIQALALELARLRGRFKEGHPEVQRAQLQMQQLQHDYDGRTAQIEEGLRVEYRQLQRREAELKQAIEAHKSRAAEQSLKLTELESLKRRADSASGLYAVLLQKLNETNIASSIQNNNVRLLDRAVVPTRPVWPRKGQIALLALAAGLLLGAGWVLLRDALDNTLKDADDVERHLHLELVATIPRYGQGDAQLATEAYHNLRTALLFARRAGLGHAVLVTSTAPGEGKTTTLLNLARLLAVSGESVVVVDCDLRRANLHLRLSLQREPGLTDVFVRGLPLAGVTQATQTAGLTAIASGPLPPNPPAVLARPELGALLAELRAAHRWVLLDSPPVAAVTDALLLAPLVDSALFVVQQNKVDRRLVRRALQALTKVTPNVLGVVLNAVDLKGAAYYGYAGYGSAGQATRAPAASAQGVTSDGGAA